MWEFLTNIVFFCKELELRICNSHMSRCIKKIQMLSSKYVLQMKFICACFLFCLIGFANIQVIRSIVASERGKGEELKKELREQVWVSSQDKKTQVNTCFADLFLVIFGMLIPKSASVLSYPV